MARAKTFPKVAQTDVDAAVEQLTKDLNAQFATALADPANAAPGTTVFPGTAKLGAPVPDVDPATLVDQEVASFKLGMSASGQVLAVDASPVKAIAEARLRGSIDAGYELLPGSIAVTVGAGTVAGGVVTFPVQGSAKQARTLDAAALKGKVLGLGKQEATDLLAPYGDGQDDPVAGLGVERALARPAGHDDPRGARGRGRRVLPVARRLGGTRPLGVAVGRAVSGVLRRRPGSQPVPSG